MRRKKPDDTEDLFGGESGEAYARRSDPDTSHAAAKHVQSNSATRLESVALIALRQHPNGLTTHELVEVTGVDWNTISPRLAPLVRKGLVIDTGVRRKGPSGRACIIWRAV